MLSGGCCAAEYKLDSNDGHGEPGELTGNMVFSVNRSFSVVYFLSKFSDSEAKC